MGKHRNSGPGNWLTKAEQAQQRQTAKVFSAHGVIHIHREKVLNENKNQAEICHSVKG